MKTLEKWQHVKLTDLAEYINGYAFKPDDWGKDGLPIIRIEQLRNPEAITDYFSGHLPDKNVINDGDLVFSWSASLFLRIWQHGKAALNQHLFKVVEKAWVDRIMLKQFIDFYLPEIAKVSHGSTMQHITRRELTCFGAMFPTSLAEQTKIAEVLSTVDRAIEQTEVLIGKQQRIKTGLMQDLLTRGIDEHGNLRSEETHQFKDSPLGRIPVEWEVKTLDELVTEIIDNRGRTPPLTDRSQYELIEISAIRGTEKTPNYAEVEKWVSEETFKSWFRQHLQKGDVLISTVGSVGLSAYIDVPRGAIAQNLIGLRACKNNCSEFMFYWTRSSDFQKTLHRVVMDAVQPSLKRPHLLSFLLKRPPLAEQQVVSEKLNSATTLIYDEQLILHKLRSLKTALMQDLLTGKVRVTPLLNDMEVTNR